MKIVEKEKDSILTCTIHEQINIGLKDAEISRIITYQNNSGENNTLDLETKTFIFPYQCSSFKCYLNGDDIKYHSDQYANTPYSKNIQLKPNGLESIYVKPTKEVIIKITCKWINFYEKIHDLFYVAYNDDEANYSITLENLPLEDNPYIILIDEKVANEDNRDYYFKNSKLEIRDIRTNNQKPVPIKIFSLPTPAKLDVFSSITQKQNKETTFEGYSILLIQHLLADSAHLIKSFIDFGVEKDAIYIVGIPYSTKQETVRYLKAQEYKNIYIPEKYPFDDLVEEALSEIILYSEEKNKKIIIVEDGGYAVPLLHTKSGSFSSDRIIGAVEQTANGIWRDKELKQLNFPVVNVAQSEIKLRLESPLIGKAVSKNIELLYNKTFRDLAGKTIGIIGYGSTGSQIAKYLKCSDTEILVYDNKSERRDDATKNGFTVEYDLYEILKKSDIIVESTGSFWTEDKGEMQKLISNFKNGSYYFSGSSKQLGVNKKILLELIDNDKSKRIPGLGMKYTFIGEEEKKITFVADGYPVNFFLGQSVPDHNISFILAWLFKCAELLCLNHEKGENIPNEIINTNEEDKFGFYESQQDINTKHNLLI